MARQSVLRTNTNNICISESIVVFLQKCVLFHSMRMDKNKIIISGLNHEKAVHFPCSQWLQLYPSGQVLISNILAQPPF